MSGEACVRLCYFFTGGLLSAPFFYGRVFVRPRFSWKGFCPAPIKLTRGFLSGRGYVRQSLHTCCRAENTKPRPSSSSRSVFLNESTVFLKYRTAHRCYIRLSDNNQQRTREHMTHWPLSMGHGRPGPARGIYRRSPRMRHPNVHRRILEKTQQTLTSRVECDLTFRETRLMLRIFPNKIWQ